MNQKILADAWLPHARRGHCGTTDEPQHCGLADFGAFEWEQVEYWLLQQNITSALERWVSACLQLCARCARCQYISVSPLQRDCSWYHECNLHRLQNDVRGFYSGARLARLHVSSPPPPLPSPPAPPPPPARPRSTYLTPAQLECDSWLTQCTHSRYDYALLTDGAAPRVLQVGARSPRRPRPLASRATGQQANGPCCARLFQYCSWRLRTVASEQMLQQKVHSGGSEDGQAARLAAAGMAAHQ
jgi:hypothetical protein